MIQPTNVSHWKFGLFIKMTGDPLYPVEITKNASEKASILNLAPYFYILKGYECARPELKMGPIFQAWAEKMDARPLWHRVWSVFISTVLNVFSGYGFISSRGMLDVMITRSTWEKSWENRENRHDLSVLMQTLRWYVVGWLHKLSPKTDFQQMNYPLIQDSLAKNSPILQLSNKGFVEGKLKDILIWTLDLSYLEELDLSNLEIRTLLADELKWLPRPLARLVVAEETQLEEGAAEKLPPCCSVWRKKREGSLEEVIPARVQSFD